MKNKVIHIEFDHDNYILRDHRVNGVRILPGVTYLDLVLRAAKELFGEVFSLSRILFTEPLATTEKYNRMVEIHFNERAKGGYEVLVRSQRIKHPDEAFGPWAEHMQARMEPLTASAAASFDISAFINSSEKKYAVAEMYAMARSVDILHGEFMQTRGQIYQRQEEELMLLELSELAEKYRPQLMVHPAFLDGATFAGSSFNFEQKQQPSSDNTPYIPFSIDKFERYAPFPQRIYVYSKGAAISAEERPDITKDDIFIYDENGQLLAFFNNLTSKRIRHPRLIKQLIEKQTQINPVQEQTLPKAENPRPAISLPPQEESLAEDNKEEAIKQFLKQIIAEKLGTPVYDIEEHLGFYDLGLDSKTTMELVRELETKCGHDFYPTLLFEYQNITDLSAYLLEEESQHFETDTTSVNEEKEVEKVQEIHFPKSFSQKLPDPKSQNEDMAIIGLSGRYPGANNLNEFWENLKAGVDSITEIPSDRWDMDGFYEEEKGKEARSYSKWGGFLDDVDKFDPLFFNISPREAEMMDPQERLFLQTVWETIEDAGYTKAQLQGKKKNKKDLGGRVGVFAGVMYEDYPLFGVEEKHKGNFFTPGGNPSSIANRVSFYFNFHGPSMAVDTMCSSSLTAIHLACESIRNGSCEVAIAGGVNLCVHPSKYLMLSQGRFVSSKGRCESFGKGGDGYVPAEGVGAVLLKPLSQAERDGDQIYGVIKGTALNHGGRTNGYSIPNPQAQALVISEAIERAGINPADISYIEAHGTGTSLGDPIEIAGLSKVFPLHKKQYCSIGSVKSNVGHGESAAGISGLSKILLQLKYRQLVPSLHSGVLNPNIDFENSPFKVQQKLEEWAAEEGQPRLAGISSFGAGGSNAHIIIEEHLATHRKPYGDAAPAIILLSAKNAERLNNYANQLLQFLEGNSDSQLHDIAYTLQQGREAMEERLAFLVSDINELRKQLDQYLAGKTANVFTGNIKKEKSTLSLKGRAGKRYVDSAIKEKEYSSLAQLWVQGTEINWNLLYPNQAPNRISLPTYPFAKDRYWVPEQHGQKGKKTLIDQLHPLLHKNSSNLKEQKFTSYYTGQESFLKDHKVLTNKVLPGVAHLEMARAAGELSLEQKITCLRDITFLSPVSVNGQMAEVQINIFPNGKEIAFEVYSQKEEKEQLHSQGKLSAKTPTAPASKDITSIRKRLAHSKTGADCYALFDSLGLHYGASFQGIKTLYYSKEEVLSKINLPKEESFQLSPGLLDSALQTCIGLSFGQESEGLALPFSIRELTIYQDLQEEMWCHIQKTKATGKVDQIRTCDISLLTEKGELVLLIKDFMALPVEGFAKTKTTAPAIEKQASHCYTYHWQRVEIADQKEEATTVEPLILLAGASAALADKLTETLALEVEAIGQDSTEAYFIELFKKVKEKLQEKGESHFILLYRNADYVDYAFVSGLFKTASQENPKLSAKLIGVDSLSIKKLEELKSILEAEQKTRDVEVRYLDGQREVKNLEPLNIAAPASNEISIKEDGVYLITGGAGGLGLIFAEYLSQKNVARIVLTGRSELTKARKQIIAKIPNASYHPCDVTNSEAVRLLIKTIKEEYGKLTGIIHSAGLIRDSFILKKTEAEIKEVLSAKIAGTKNLDEATKDLALDFMVYFSSLSAVSGNAGQADYAAANAFLDNYAAHRESQQIKGKRQGKTLSINWPLWKEGGMQIDEETQKYLASQMGIYPLPTEEGLKIFETLLQGKNSQAALVFGLQSKIQQQLLPAENPVEKGTEKSTESANDNLQEKTEQTILQFSSDLLKLNIKEIDLHENLGEYGFDSVSLTKLSNELNEFYDLDLMPTVFFNHPTVAELAAHLVADYQDNLLKQHSQTLVTKEATNNPIPPTNFKATNRKTRFLSNAPQRNASPIGQNFSTEPIAIIGISGRFPGSPDLAHFWENLKTNKDLIVEIPEDRWDWKQYYGDPKTERNKTKAKWGGFINDVDKFDPLFFNISPMEAELMDPQQRLVLETVYTALEDAAISTSSIKGSDTGAFIGVSSADYSMLLGDQKELVSQAQYASGMGHSILVNRLSYLLDIHGPSEPIDTACSSSLIAIHRAVENIRNGHCEMAITGGVNVILVPEISLSFSQAGMLSEDGRCKTFDQSANGYVRGEGVAVVILKSLSKAEADGDQIYGLIRGTAENHGGRANTLTAPNPNAQKELLVKAYRSAGIDPRDVTYLEAHGTGTPLGDPIETEGLKLAFKELYEENELPNPKAPYCALGSVKTNIGHLEAAAGMAGVMKVLLSLKHKTIPGNPQLKSPNAYLKLADTPFYLSEKTSPWESIDQKPRIAGISSFGFGGANAHIIIEEYPAKEQTTYSNTAAALIVLSAKNEERLEAYSIKLIKYLEANATINLHDLAYTLQIGRDAMEERLAILSHSQEELMQKLQAYVDGQRQVVFIGQAPINKPAKEFEEAITKAIDENNHHELAALWVKGATIDWPLLYPNQKPNKLSLPTYPFARERYWIPAQSQQMTVLSHLHPLVHRNSSNLKEQKFSSLYSGAEVFFAEHLVQGKKILPAAAYLEMARAAGAFSTEQSITQIQDISWLSPIQINEETVEVQISLYPRGDEVAFDIYTQDEDGEQIHSQGRMRTKVLPQPALVDIPAIRKRLPASKEGTACYALFNKLGIQYGPTFQGIEQLYYSEKEVLSKITLPKDEDYVLNPALLDSALQTCIGLSLDKEIASLALPFSIKEITIYESLSENCWCYIKPSKGHKKDSAIASYDLDLLNEEGEVLVAIKEFVAVPLERPAEHIQVEVMPSNTAQKDLKEAATKYLRDLLSTELKLSEKKLALDIPFEKYGIDSRMINTLTIRLDQVFGKLPRTLFFEYQTLGQLINYFLTEHEDQIRQLSGSKSKPLTAAAASSATESILPTRTQQRFVRSASTISSTTPNDGPIAIIGLSGRYPGANSIEAFWENLKGGVDSITEIPKDRWELERFYDPEKGKEGKSYSKWGGFIDDVDKFDPLFFNISPREAELMDPQERLFLQTVWETIEDAGYTRSDLSGVEQADIGIVLGKKVGVYVGVMYEEYQLLGVEERSKGNHVVPGGSPSSIANRVSYFFNFHGPSMAVDTMCSSSITAIHLACESIQHGGCEVAIAGGVNVSVHPNKYLLLSQGQFASSKGRCESFGEGGEGYVPSEGVGAVLLKPLWKAERDGDRIYGLIKGSALNHGGKTNGYTVPNPVAQSVVIKEALEKANVNATDISYIEAHGTGTSLGDPIEIAGLSKVFPKDQKQYCSIGSVKSNIGHGESAAGISGVTKVLLQLKHQQLVPSLHSADLNPNIDFENSPFKVQQKLTDWTVDNNQPRLAGISSFGAGGSNAHILIEEYQATAQSKYEIDEPAIIVLSARNEERLKVIVARLQQFLHTNEEALLHDIAYTLQTGREAMEERLALVVDNKEKLLHQLERYLTEPKSKHFDAGLFSGNIHQDKMDLLLEGGAGQAYINFAVANKELNSLAQLWVKGVKLDWNLYYTDQKPQKIALPTYPFAKDRYWIVREGSAAIQGINYQLHPLVHQNESDLNEQKFTSIFSGQEPFLAEHKVREEKVLPGVAYLELAREAGKRSTRQKITQLIDVTWLSPISVNGSPEKVHISLHPSNGTIAYEVYAEKEEQRQAYSQGKLSTAIQTAPESINIAAIQERLSQSIGKEECYQLFKTAGLNYGSSFQGIEQLYYSAEEALSKISLPPNEQYILAPGLLDSALQTCIGLNLGSENQGLQLPFSVQEVTIYEDLPETIWSYVRKRNKENSNSQLIHYDVDLLNEEGAVLLSFRDFIILPLDGFAKPALKEKAASHLYEPLWQAREIETSEASNSEQLVLLAGGPASLADRLKERLAIEVEALDQQDEEGFFISILEKIKGKLEEKSTTHISILCQEDQYMDYAFVSGMLKSASQENPKITGKIICVEQLTLSAIDELATIIEAEQSTRDHEVRYRNGSRAVKILQKKALASNTSASSLIKENGVYLITGGLGSLGLIFAEHISQTKGAQLLLVGRSKLNKERKALLSKFPNATYYSCDVSKQKSVQSLIKRIKKTHQKIDGIIHSAGVGLASVIPKKTRKEITAVFDPKIKGVKNLDEATKNEALDFMILFSSVAGVLGDIGLSDYASANAYLDNYAVYRNEKRAQGQRQGRTLSINWGFWKDGGMQISEDSEKYLENQWGMVPMPTEEGLLAFDALLQSQLNQGLILYGKEQQIKEKVEGTNKEKAPTRKAVDLSEKDLNKLKGAALDYIGHIFSEELKLPKDKILAHLPLENYGIDSILIVKITNRLSDVFEKVPSTLLFEHQNVGELVDYFIQEHTQRLRVLTKQIAEPVATNGKTQQLPVFNTSKVIKNRFLQSAEKTKPSADQTDIAIIGLSGRYPGARNMNEFWDNLKTGVDSITEIPKDRWDISRFYDPEKGIDGKSYSKWGGFLDDVDKFDPLFFNISPLEAEIMDPQERLFLQTVWETIEDAGYTKAALQGLGKTTEANSLGAKIGVYVGVMYEEYQLLGLDQRQQGNCPIPGGNPSSIANRVSYFFNFHGPSMAIDTACSSSLTAVHQACQSIRLEECEVAIAGGVNVSVHPNKYLMLSQGRFVSSKGRCESFGEGGEGYVPAEGVGAVLLKPLWKAKEDGDQIYGVIKGSAINHGGKTNGYTVPNPKAQSEVIRKAIQEAGVQPEDISYVEAHGTGTSLGDPIEMAGLSKAFASDKKQYCSIGSVKSNIGHCESAAGISGLTKILLQLRHQQLVPSLHSATLNPNIDFEDSPFKVQQTLEDWPRENDKVRLAGLSSFGAGGSNAHLIIEEYQQRETVPYQSDEPAIVLLSAKNKERLKEYVSKLKNFVEQHTQIELHDIAYTLQTGREALEERLAIVTTDKDELIQQLKQYLNGKTEDLLTGNIKKNKSKMLLDGEAVIEAKESSSLAQSWVNGAHIDWNLLYEKQRPKKISLPTYPFARRRYWIAVEEPVAAANGNHKLHPLLHVEESEKLHPLLHKHENF